MVGKSKIIIIAGPTATGKTAVAVEVALALGGEVVGADSMQVYRGLVIGAASPTLEQMRGVPHHLIGVIAPSEHFTTWDWLARAETIIADISSRGKVAIVAGGAGLYIRSLLHGMFDAPYGDPELRKRIRARSESENLHETLRRVDPASASRIHPNDEYRIVRALEVFEQTARPLSEQQREWSAPERYEAIKIALDLPREELHLRINRRAELMIENGLVDEVRGLKELGLSRDMRPMRHFGYRHIWACIEGEISLEEALSLMQRDTRRYARRQLTWFRAEPGMTWLHPEKDLTRITEMVRSSGGTTP